jgi:hypothetical protein
MTPESIIKDISMSQQLIVRVSAEVKKALHHIKEISFYDNTLVYNVVPEESKEYLHLKDGDVIKAKFAGHASNFIDCIILIENSRIFFLQDAVAGQRPETKNFKGKKYSWCDDGNVRIKIGDVEYGHNNFCWPAYGIKEIIISGNKIYKGIEL